MANIRKWGKFRFHVEGLSIEKLVKLCGEKGILLEQTKRSGIKGLTACCPYAQLDSLKQLCEAKGWKLSHVEHTGWRAWWEKVKQHRMGIVAAALMAALVAAAMPFVWQIKIEDAGAYEGDLRTYLSEQGVNVGILKAHVNLSQLCSSLEWRYPRVAWVQTDLRGCTLIIRLVEGVPAPDIAPYGEAGDVVASRGGVILSVEPQAGTAVVTPGDIVVPGQVLIKGVENRGEETVCVKARGLVWARVWDRVGVEIPMHLNLSEPTGRTTTLWEIGTLGKRFSLDETPDYHLADADVRITPVGGIWWPVWVQQTIYEEINIRQEERSQEEVKAEAEHIAVQLLHEKIGLNDDLVDKWVDYCMIEGGKVAAYATAERRMNIAGFAPYTSLLPSP